MDARTLIGSRAGPSAWRQVTQAQIDTFAQLSGDRQWIHVDAERARRESPYGCTIAHGNLTLALIDGIRDELAPLDGAIGVNYGYERVRFPAPVPAGARVRGRSETLAVEQRPDGWWRIVQRFTVELDGGAKPACVADSVVLIRMLGG
ncbi:MAG: 3-hydroxyacyl-thioester dehydratase HtdZ [Solirubrobacteraceae bacterium]